MLEGMIKSKKHIEERLDLLRSLYFQKRSRQDDFSSFHDNWKLLKFCIETKAIDDIEFLLNEIPELQSSLSKNYQKIISNDIEDIIIEVAKQNKYPLLEILLNVFGKEISDVTKWKVVEHFPRVPTDDGDIKEAFGINFNEEQESFFSCLGILTRLLSYPEGTCDYLQWCFKTFKNSLSYQSKVNFYLSNIKYCLKKEYSDVLDICVEAIEYMTKGGCLLISTSKKELILEKSYEEGYGDIVKYILTENGSGISNERKWCLLKDISQRYSDLPHKNTYNQILKLCIDNFTHNYFAKIPKNEVRDLLCIALTMEYKAVAIWLLDSLKHDVLWDFCHYLKQCKDKVSKEKIEEILNAYDIVQNPPPPPLLYSKVEDEGFTRINNTYVIVDGKIKIQVKKK